MTFHIIGTQLKAIFGIVKDWIRKMYVGENCRVMNIFPMNPNLPLSEFECKIYDRFASMLHNNKACRLTSTLMLDLVDYSSRLGTFVPWNTYKLMIYDWDHLCSNTTLCIQIEYKTWRRCHSVVYGYIYIYICLIWCKIKICLFNQKYDL